MYVYTSTFFGMRHTHENIDLNSDTKLLTKPSIPAPIAKSKVQHNHISFQQTENDYSQDDFDLFDQNMTLPDENNEIKQPKHETVNNLDIHPHDYTEEITDFVNRAASLYSEENIIFLKKELNKKGLVLSFQPPPFNYWQCVVCSDNPKNPVVLPCGHISCQNCINEWSKHSNFCPVCYAQLDQENAIEIRSFLDKSPKKK